MGISMNRNSGVKQMTIKNKDGSTAGTITIHSPGQKKTKKLSYRFRRISNRIIQAKTSGSARQVLTSAKGETVSLRRKLVSGKYDANEVRRAIVHAERMERIAKKRMKHLQQEESIEKQNGSGPAGFDEEILEEDGEDLEGLEFAELDLEEIKELMQEIQEEMEQLAQDNSLDELVQAMQTDMDPEELEQLKKKHRAEEMREIAEADLKYLKALFDQLERERQESASPSSGNVSLELSGVQIPVQIDERSAAEVVASGTSAAAQGGNIDVSV